MFRSILGPLLALLLSLVFWLALRQDTAIDLFRAMTTIPEHPSEVASTLDLAAIGSEIDMLLLGLKRNHKWAPNGRLDYARSARKWKIAPSDQTTFHVRSGTLVRTFAPPAAGLVPSEDAPVSAGPQNVFQLILRLFRRKKPGKRGKGQGTATEGGDAEVPADDVQNDLEYVVPIRIGTPGVTVNLDFDTGSSDLWVWGSSLTTNASQHNVYDPTKSSTSAPASGLTWNISYGDGSSASGDVYTDIVTLGGLSIPTQAVEIAENLSSAFSSGGGSDGLLGLAFPILNTVQPTQQLTPVANMIAQSLVQQPIFTVKLDKEDSKGFYTFGALAPDSASGANSSDIKYTSVISTSGFWEFSSPNITINGVTSKREDGNTAIADTGTTLLLLSDAACTLVYKQVKGAKLDPQAGGWTFPTSSALPEKILFAVGPDGNEFGIPGEDLKFADAGDGRSFGAIQSKGGNPQDILGDVFLKRVYAVFDQTPDAPRIGFAQRSFT